MILQRSDGGVCHFNERRDLLNSGWVDNWVFAGAAQELGDLIDEYIRQYATPDALASFASRLHTLVRDRNTPGGHPVPSAVGCYITATGVICVLFLP